MLRNVGNVTQYFYMLRRISVRYRRHPTTLGGDRRPMESNDDGSLRVCAQCCP